jgi:HlyD family secretion protein
VIERAIDRGQTVAAGFQTPTLFTIAQDLATMQILASVDESQIGSVKVGQQASFAVSAFPGKMFPAQVQQIRLKPTVTQNVVTYSVVLNANNAQGELFPGMTATVDFVLQELRGVWRVPSAALRVQRVPLTMMDAETIDRFQDKAEKQATGLTEGSSTPATRAMRNANPSGRSAVWIMQGDKARHVPVRVLGSDLAATAIEPLSGEFTEQQQVIIKLSGNSSAAPSNASRSLLSPPPNPHR